MCKVPFLSAFYLPENQQIRYFDYSTRHFLYQKSEWSVILTHSDIEGHLCVQQAMSSSDNPAFAENGAPAEYLTAGTQYQGYLNKKEKELRAAHQHIEHTAPAVCFLSCSCCNKATHASSFTLKTLPATGSLPELPHRHQQYEAYLVPHWSFHQHCLLSRAVCFETGCLSSHLWLEKKS